MKRAQNSEQANVCVITSCQLALDHVSPEALSISLHCWVTCDSMAKRPRQADSAFNDSLIQAITLIKGKADSGSSLANNLQTVKSLTSTDCIFPLIHK